MRTSSGRYIGVSSGRHFGRYIGCPQRSVDIERGRPQNVGRRLPWRYLEDLMGTSIGGYLGISSGRPWDIILSSG